MFELDPKLAEDCIMIGSLDLSLLLLINNALLPWLVIVPKCKQTELTDLSNTDQARVLAEINAVSSFLKNNFPGCKLNIATIGNVVSQLHVHVIGRHETDFCWPNVVWGQTKHKPYSAVEIEKLSAKLVDQLGIKQH